LVSLKYMFHCASLKCLLVATRFPLFLSLSLFRLSLSPPPSHAHTCAYTHTHTHTHTFQTYLCKEACIGSTARAGNPTGAEVGHHTAVSTELSHGANTGRHGLLDALRNNNAIDRRGNPCNTFAQATNNEAVRPPFHQVTLA
jgi:hypothetical protein